MADQPAFERRLGRFLAEGSDEVADRVIDAALDEVHDTHQRHAERWPWRFQTMNVTTRFAAVAAVGVLAIGGALYLTRPTQPRVGNQSPTASVDASPSQTARAATWTSTGRMFTDSPFASATLLADGRVLVAGGGQLDGSKVAELYDPERGTWTLTGTMATPRVGHSATLLPDGRVLVAGGAGAATESMAWLYGDRLMGPASASAELYDPRSGVWTSTGPMIDARGIFTATLLRDGKVLVVGGASGSPDGPDGLASAELYDPGLATWTATGRMFAPRVGPSATLLADGRVLVAGGYGNCKLDVGCEPLASAELYDPGTGLWSAAQPMTAARADFTATLLPDGRVLVAGGGGGPGSASCCAFPSIVRDLPSAELYDPASGTWAATGQMINARIGQTATLMTDGKVLVAGGRGSSAELYDPATGFWTATASMRGPRIYFTATLLLDGRVLVAGNPTTAELYDPGSGN